MRLAGLLRRLLGETERLRAPGELPCRFRISSVEPRDVDDALVDLLATADGRICRHLHLPLQSGSSKVLREMARPYDCLLYTSLPKGISGLKGVRSILEGLDDIAFCDFTGKDVVRHSLVAAIVAAYDQASRKA